MKARCEDCREMLACEVEHSCRDCGKLLCGHCGHEHKDKGHDCVPVKD